MINPVSSFSWSWSPPSCRRSPTTSAVASSLAFPRTPRAYAFASSCRGAKRRLRVRFPGKSSPSPTSEHHDGLTVAKTFALAINEAAKLHPAAEPLIVYAALFAPEPIPLFLFSQGREKFGEPLATALVGDGLDETLGYLHAWRDRLTRCVMMLSRLCGLYDSVSDALIRRSVGDAARAGFVTG